MKRHGSAIAVIAVVVVFVFWDLLRLSYGQ